MISRGGQNQLYLTWKHPQTRERYVIGCLTKDNRGYYFNYYLGSDTRNVSDAQKTGVFQLLPHLDDFYKSYHAPTLFPFFAARLPKYIDSKLAAELEKQGLTSDDFHILQATGGRLPIDDFEFIDPISLQKHEIEVETAISGWRYYSREEELGNLTEGQKIMLEVEVDNKYDPNAIVVKTEENKKLGYLPAAYSHYFEAAVKKGHYRAYVKRVKPSFAGIPCTIFVQAQRD
jgi:hypothetical protein